MWYIKKINILVFVLLISILNTESRLNIRRDGNEYLRIKQSQMLYNEI